MQQRARRETPSQTAREKWLRRLFRLGVVIKGVDGVLETVGGALFLLVSRVALKWSVFRLTQRILMDDPDDWLAHSLRHAFSHLSADDKLFGGFYLLGHGLLKVFLVVALLREQLWAFPTAMGVLAGFMGYQAYRLLTHFSWLLVGLTCLDAVILLLIWHEYRRLKRASRSSSDV